MLVLEFKDAFLLRFNRLAQIRFAPQIDVRRAAERGRNFCGFPRDALSQTPRPRPPQLGSPGDSCLGALLHHRPEWLPQPTGCSSNSQ